MVKVIGVRFRRAGKVYYFDPGVQQMEKGVLLVPAALLQEIFPTTHLLQAYLVK